ncbi:exodeoxyribonuclease VII large subunit [Roseomonas sp. KE2513]|uniref:exodeoxyribonuclease VII large subunit n=1 Tax=Roseomonas sp. KE2513 TaxID=2479202 RepID=UPI0018DFF3E8|nr:exodeoxyribonuclease VII large subunit [Roseomonas sp. KE2513]MBI0538954.1 exodeoxyribonuclease VII large subunit [Roseomonas sp. KE2513]
MDGTHGNIPEYSVSEISGAVKRTLETAFGRIRVRGEITEFKTYPSGHSYLSMKDETGTIRAIIWRGALSKLAVRPENGVEVIATGKITASDKRSDYALQIERLEYAGEGALLARIERLRLRLGAEGLFDEDRKRPLPFLPEVIGVITSEKGAVLHDIRTTLARRFPRRVLLIPVAVQGQGAAEQVASAIATMGALSPLGRIPRPDVIIVARGGGSLEDLMAFNEEVVVRAAAASPIPLISAVGHETDTTLIDFASDRRAPTPTAAAELAVPSREELAAALDQRGTRLARAAHSVLDRGRIRLDRAAKGLPDLPALIAAGRNRLEDRAHRLQLAPRALIGAKRRLLEGTAARLPRPQEAIASRRAALSLLELRIGGASRAAVGRQSRALARMPDLAPLLRARLREARAAETRAAERLDAAAQRRLAERSATLARIPDPTPFVTAHLRQCRSALRGLSARLEGASYQALLERGFALVRDTAGQPVTAAAQVAPGQRLSLQFADGSLGVTDDRAKRRERGGGTQETLL